MRKTPLLLAVLLAVAVVFTVRAEENAPKKEEAKKETAAPAPVGVSQTLTGDLSIRYDGKTTLKVKEEKSWKTYVLWPDADVAKSLEPLAKKKAHAEVTGLLSPDGVNLKVSSVTEKKEEKKKGK